MSTQTTTNETLLSAYVGLQTRKVEEKKNEAPAGSTLPSATLTDHQSRFEHGEEEPTTQAREADVREPKEVAKGRASKAPVSFLKQKEAVKQQEKVVEKTVELLKKLDPKFVETLKKQAPELKPQEVVEKLKVRLQELKATVKEKGSQGTGGLKEVKALKDLKELVKHQKELVAAEAEVEAAFHSESSQAPAEGAGAAENLQSLAPAVEETVFNPASATAGLEETATHLADEIRATLSTIPLPQSASSVPSAGSFTIPQGTNAEEFLAVIDRMTAVLDKKNKEIATLKLDPSKSLEQIKKLQGEIAATAAKIAKATTLAVELQKTQIASELGAKIQGQKETLKSEKDRPEREEERSEQRSSGRAAATASSQSVQRPSASAESGDQSSQNGPALAGVNSVAAGSEAPESAGGEAAAPASLTEERATFVSTQSTNPSDLMASIASTGTFLTVQSTTQDLKSEIHKSDDLLKKLVRSLQSGNMDSLPLVCIVAARRDSLATIRVATSVLKFLDNNNKTIQGLTDQLPQFQDGGSGAAAGLAGINTQIQQKLGDAQMAKSLLQESLQRLQQVYEFSQSVTTISGRIGLRLANMVGQ